MSASVKEFDPLIVQWKENNPEEKKCLAVPLGESYRITLWYAANVLGIIGYL